MPVCKKCGRFSNAAAKRLLVRGLSVAHVATLLGNTETIVTAHYSKWIPERQEAFDSAIRAVWNTGKAQTS
jgi:predicted transcriptional regulator